MIHVPFTKGYIKLQSAKSMIFSYFQVEISVSRKINMHTDFLF
jgi:hypothetical protein